MKESLHDSCLLGTDAKVKDSRARSFLLLFIHVYRDFISSGIRVTVRNDSRNLIA